MTTTATEVWEAAHRRVDPASVAAFRFAFGVLVAVASVRFLAKGWVHEHFVEPKVFFPYWGFEWVRPLSEPMMVAAYVAMVVTGIGIALGAAHRLCAALFFVAFSYTHLCDKTHYLNHYYLVSLLALLLAVLPVHHHYSVDAWVARRRGRPVPPWPPAWTVWLLRLQVGAVYFFGGVAKLGPDWMVHALPLRIWLTRATDVAVIGGIFKYQATAYAMSWAGAAFDITVPLWLSIRRTRPYAFLAVLGFHAMVGKLFQLGMFPWFMPAFATIFFDPSWPRRLWKNLPVAPEGQGAARSPKWALGLALAYAVVQVVVPLRHLVYPNDVLWSEEGFRFAWKVMLQEKNGVVTAKAVDRATGERFYIAPSDYLTPLQERMMSTQPDMILQFAHIVRDDFAKRGRDVAVYVDARVSLNGRPSRPLVDSSVDLAHETESLAPKRWVTPKPSDPPRL